MNNTFKPNRLPKYDEGSLINEIKRVISKYFKNVPPQLKDFQKYSMVSGTTLFKHFGTWRNALKKAGYKTIEEEMREDLKTISNLNSGIFFTYDYYIEQGGKFALRRLKNVFRQSDWQGLLENVLSLKKPPKKIRIVKNQRKRVSEFTENQLFSELKRVWEKLGRRPTYLEFRTIGTIGTKVYERRFSNWTKAIETFSLKFNFYTQSNDNCNTTPALLLSELRAIASKITSPILTFDNYKKYGGVHSKVTFQNHIGSWRLAVEQIGKKDGVGKGRYSKEDLFAELQRVWELIGCQPTKREMKERSNIPVSLFEQRFGSWIKAIHAFCSDRENPDDAKQIDKEINNYIQQIKIDPQLLDDKKQEAKIETGENYIVMMTSRTPSLRLRFKVLKRDNFRCVKCGRSPATHPTVELEIDHDKPYSLGGETVIENLLTLCRDCNRGKGNLY